ncbi:hypothetical protein UY3_08003 [Chelonia mydas]|uniref:Uncharacterized protein n=1 Tax=Chelonia mydas TaxID=8469 RepID=M7C327_CHEMY|nr:hypothetical protein UY3_08003 [Chelonia mydas]
MLIYTRVLKFKARTDRKTDQMNCRCSTSHHQHPSAVKLLEDSFNKTQAGSVHWKYAGFLMACWGPQVPGSANLRQPHHLGYPGVQPWSLAAMTGAGAVRSTAGKLGRPENPDQLGLSELPEGSASSFQGPRQLRMQTGQGPQGLQTPGAADPGSSSSPETDDGSFSCCFSCSRQSTALGKQTDQAGARTAVGNLSE